MRTTKSAFGANVRIVFSGLIRLLIIALSGTDLPDSSHLFWILCRIVSSEAETYDTEGQIPHYTSRLIIIAIYQMNHTPYIENCNSIMGKSLSNVIKDLC